jgi:hypothetical protein
MNSPHEASCGGEEESVDGEGFSNEASCINQSDSDSGNSLVAHQITILRALQSLRKTPGAFPASVSKPNSSTQTLLHD